MTALVSGGVHLPGGSPALIQQAPDESELSDWSEDSDAAGSPPNSSLAEHFPSISQAITEAIAELGGAIVPKLNWSCPQAGCDLDYSHKDPQMRQC
ncbi:hypothetical protein WJX84_001193 [Apatococcus fuscideae]|uniref:Uncharacterized protein n=1 Tax=Apatococcus fuscideae TaxID=2026836 RepID=A0AAW1T6Z5_9CHLO